MNTGTMKKPLDGKDFGFIAADDQKPGDKDVFFHRDSLEGVEMSELKEGDKLSYELEESARGPKAVHVKRI